MNSIKQRLRLDACFYSILLSFLCVLVFIGCHETTGVDADKLIGSWEIDVSANRGLIYTYNKDGTFTVEMSGKGNHSGFADHGRWNLEGAVLHSELDFASITNKGAKPAVYPVNSESVTVYELTDSSMAWGNSMLGSKLKLRRVSAP